LAVSSGRMGVGRGGLPPPIKVEYEMRKLLVILASQQTATLVTMYSRKPYLTDPMLPV